MIQQLGKEGLVGDWNFLNLYGYFKAYVQASRHDFLLPFGLAPNAQMFSSWGRSLNAVCSKPETRWSSLSSRWSHAQKCTSTCTWNRLKPTKMSWSYLKPSIIPQHFDRFIPSLFSLITSICWSTDLPVHHAGSSGHSGSGFEWHLPSQISVTWDDGFEVIETFWKVKVFILQLKPLKIGGWKMTCPFWGWPIFKSFVRFREGMYQIR